MMAIDPREERTIRSYLKSVNIYIYIYIYIGVGFGLSISKQLTEAMGGSIHFESNYDIGSKFTFSIPFDIITDHPAQQIESPSNISATEIILNTEMSQRTIPIERT